MIPYENFTGLSGQKSLEVAQEVLSKGWSLGGYPAVSLGAIPWAMESNKLRSWNFHIHSWDMLDSVLHAYSEFKERHYLEASISVALEWSALFSPRLESIDQSMAWYDMAVGLRAYRLAFVIDAADEIGLLDDADRKALWYCLVEHQAYLSNDKNIHFHNNHGYFQAAGQVAMGRRFANRDVSMKDAYEQGRSRLARMLSQQFADDGVHKEHSPDYHRMVCETLKALVDSGLMGEDVSELYYKIESSLSWFILPSGYLANFGDSDQRLMLCSPSAAEARWKSEEMRYLVTSGAIGKSSENVMMAFRGGGYYVVRKSHVDLPKSNDSYLAQIACFHSRTHKHVDDLSFIWSDRGGDILVDAGRYGYVDKTEPGSDLWMEGFWYADQNRIYCESAHAHNTLEFDDKSSPRRGVKPYGVAMGRAVEHESGVYVMESECKHFGSIRHARVLVFLPGQWLIVFDWFKDNLNVSHDVKQWFHFARGFDVQKEANGYVALAPAGNVLQVRPCFSECKGSDIFLGEESPKMQGWWSPSERTLLANSAICFELRKREQGSFAALFSFSENLFVDQERSFSSISGRAFRICWRDGSKECRLRVARPMGADMEVEYTAI